ncbi:MAG: hypothetical protein E7554_05075 [Ruminococcaceae bacterium]|nr:hypothetical protein [Oscillospiraceae bacterium]
MGIKAFFKKAFGDMKKSAQAQHEVDKANFAAAKAEARADFESHRGSVTFRKAKADARATWEDARLSPAERQAKMQEEREAQIAAANERKAAAEARIEELKK